MSLDYHSLNAKLNILTSDGLIDFESDKQAVEQFFLQYVEPETMKFGSTEEKLRFLLDNGYYDPEVFEQYDFDDLVAFFDVAYGYGFKFESFMGAYKYYQMYNLKTFDGKKHLECFEDRAASTSLYLARGDLQEAYLLLDEILSGRFQPATPTFLNAGRVARGEMISCYLLEVSDNMESIAKAVHSSLQLSKRGGGVALNLTDLRESGAPIKGIEGQASGVVPVMKMLEDSFSYANQLGSRQGAGAVYLNIHHPDVHAFLDTKRENADEKIRIKTLSVGLVIPDITFELAKTGESMYLFSPYDVERVYGVPFSKINVTEKYYEMVADDRIRKKKTDARMLFQDIAAVSFESGYPYLMFEDNVNRVHNVPGKVTMSNLCVTGDTRLLTAEGYKRVKDLYDSQESIRVQADRRAITFDAGNNEMSVEDSTRMHKTAEDAEVYLLSTNEGYELKATAWHKMYVEREGEIVKIPLAELVPGDRILVQGSESVSHNEADMSDIAYISGVIASDGTFGQRRDESHFPRVDLYGNKKQFAGQIEAAVARVLSEEEVTHHSAKAEPRFVASKHADRISLSSSPLGRVLERFGYTKENKLSVPEFVFQGDLSTKKAFLSGVWSLDGSITRSGGLVSAELGSTNKGFLQQLQMLMAELGVRSRIYAGHRAGYRLMPDGKGGSKMYKCKATWSLRVSNYKNLQKFIPMISWMKEHLSKWEELTSKLVKTPCPIRSGYATVKSIEFAGTEDVYDVTVENGNSVVFNGIVTGQCSEILQRQTPSVLNPDGSFVEVGEDISCNLGSLNIVKAVEGPDFSQTVESAVRALTAVSDLSNVDSVPTVANGNRNSHAIGLGQMNLHAFFAKNRVHYGDEVSLDLTRMYFMTVAYYAIRASNKLAMERGETFIGFEDSRYADGSYFDMYLEGEELKPQFNRTKEILGHIGIPTREDWAKLKESVMEHGLYNAYLQAVPPTGSISYINNSTSSIHPIASLIEIRKEGKLGRIYYPAPYLTNENMEYYADAYEIGPKPIIDVYAEATKFVDQGLSLTLFYKDTTTTRDVNRNYIYAWRKGIKTLYYMRLRQKALDGTQVAGTAADICVSCQL